MSNNMDERPSGKQVVVVTGASSGVGRAVAWAFGERGARVGLLSRNEDALNAAAAVPTVLGALVIARRGERW